MEVKLKNITFSYHKINYQEKKILEELNINFKTGTINSIIGKNGSGKSTLLNLLSLNIFPQIGTIDYGNYHFSSRKEKIDIEKIQNKIGYLPQEEEFVSDTVIEELEYAMLSHNYFPKNKERRIVDSLIMVHLDSSVLNKKINELSKIEKRKILLASILIYNPDLYLLDDPTKNLDNKGKNELIKLLRMLKKRYNKTIIIASNDIDFVHQISDQISLLANGKIVINGNKYDVFKSNINEYKISYPKVIEFSNLVLNKKNIKIGYRDEINDLIKDIYRYVK
jgi:energy-coupling factor transporter ATP-binding protein EcfA2